MLKQRAFNATLWSGADILLRQGIQFIIAICLARILNPTDYGLFGFALLFSSIASVFADGGFSAALIQRQDANHADESTVFWFNVVMSVLVALLLCAAAPVIARFYTQPQLASLIALMALNVLFGALGTIHTTLLTKSLDFRTQARVGLIAMLLSGTLAVWMAWHGYGVWALAIQATTMSGVNTALLWATNKWRPAKIFNPTSARKFFAFGGYHFASTLLDSAYSRLYTIPIAKIHGMSALGYYTNADNIQQMPSGVLVKVFTRVALPMFSSLSHDASKLRRGMQMANRAMMLINAPVMLGMAAVADPMVCFVFGVQWAPSVPIFRVLCLAGLFLPLHVLNLNFMMAMGLSREMFKIEICKKALGVLLLGAGASFGVMGIAWSMVAVSMMGLVFNARYSRLIEYSLAAQIRDCLPILIVAGVMSGVLACLEAYWQAPYILEFVVLTTLGAGLFFGIALVARLDAMNDVISLFYKSNRNQRNVDPT